MISCTIWEKLLKWELKEATDKTTIMVLTAQPLKSEQDTENRDAGCVIQIHD